jgi:hypothetical protein
VGLSERKVTDGTCLNVSDLVVRGAMDLIGREHSLTLVLFSRARSSGGGVCNQSLWDTQGDRNDCDYVTSDVAILGRPPQNFEQYATDYAAAFSNS